jgi:hypothetical protein
MQLTSQFVDATSLFVSRVTASGLASKRLACPEKGLWKPQVAWEPELAVNLRRQTGKDQPSLWLLNRVFLAGFSFRFRLISKPRLSQMLAGRLIRAQIPALQPRGGSKSALNHAPFPLSVLDEWRPSGVLQPRQFINSHGSCTRFSFLRLVVLRRFIRGKSKLCISKRSGGRTLRKTKKSWQTRSREKNRIRGATDFTGNVTAL